MSTTERVLNHPTEMELPTMLRMMTVRVVPRASYVAGGASDDAKGVMRMEVPCSMTMRDLAAEVLRETSAPTTTMRVRAWLGMNAHRNAEEGVGASAPAMQMYAVDECELVPVPPLTRVEDLASLARGVHVLSDAEVTVYYAYENKFGDGEEELCLACCALCACCFACCAASSAASAAADANSPKPQSYVPPDTQGTYNYANNNNYNDNQNNPNMYVAQQPNGYGQPPMNYNQQPNWYVAQQPNYYGPPPQPQPNQYSPPPPQGMPVSGQAVPGAFGGYPSVQYGNPNYNGIATYGQPTIDAYSSRNAIDNNRAGNTSPQEVIFCARPPSPRRSTASPEFSPAEGRDDSEYPTERPPAAATDSGLPPPQYQLSGFDNANTTFDEARKHAK